VNRFVDRVYSPAKINLFLKVLGKRSDGYHGLITLFQTINLGDYLCFSLTKEVLCVDAPAQLPTGPENLVFRAALYFYERAGIKPGVRIVLEKNIPVAAGLGGGSSNAATTLAALNRLYHYPLTGEVLMELARKIGSDVPFFLGGGTALGEGRGDEVRWLADLPCFWVRVVKPPFGLSTATVYAHWEGDSRADWVKASAALKTGDYAQVLANDLEAAAFGIFPELKAIKERLMASGARAALLSGSGSCVFGIYYEQPKGDIALPEGYAQWTVSTLPYYGNGRPTL
jgi:4-diphosphocytidyl-2-C-methyl-D-erythritol kinase